MKNTMKAIREDVNKTIRVFVKYAEVHRLVGTKKMHVTSEPSEIVA